MSQKCKTKTYKSTVNHPNTTTFHQHLELSWFFDGFRVAHLFSFL